MFGTTAHSWVDPVDPLRIEFEYVERLVEALEATVLARPPDDHVRVVHVGGGGLTIPRYVAARRPRTAQIVLEPDADLTMEVRRRAPLPPRSGIRVRPVDGRAGIAAMPLDYADALVLDAFDGARVPADLVSAEFLADARARCRAGALFAANVSDRAPFGWAKRFVAGVRAEFTHVLVNAETAVWKGRRFGNLIVLSSDAPLPEAVHRLPAIPVTPYRGIAGRELVRWLGGAQPFADTDATPSPAPPLGWSR